MNIKNSLVTLFLSAALLVTAGTSYASSGASQCQIIYGGGQVCQDQVKFTVDKKVMQPTKGGGYVDNLTANDVNFHPGSDVAFQITITNTGDKTIGQLNVVDTLPSNLLFISGAGKYNSSDNTVVYSVSNLEAGKSNQQTFVARVGDNSKFEKSITCLTNAVRVADNNGNNASDNSGFCVANGVTQAPAPKVFTTVPPKTIPNTGPELLSLLGLIPMGAAGIFLRKKSKLG